MIDGHEAAISELWRYPVKSMRGERIDAADVDEAGIVGDRAYAVVDAATGKVGSAKHPRLWGALLQCEARYLEPPSAGAAPAPLAVTLPDGSGTGSDDPDVDARLSTVFGRPVRLATVAPEAGSYLAVWPAIDGVAPQDFLDASAVEGDEPEGLLTDLGLALAAPHGTLFDVAALHVLTASTLDRLGELAPASRFAVERYRPNVVVGSAGDAFAENGWSGSVLRLGAELTASVLIPTMRCIMTTLAQGDLPRDNEVLRTLSRHNRVEIPGLGTWSCVGAYAAVTAPGRVRVGDEVDLAAV
jgi:MOSC domain-containing protein